MEKKTGYGMKKVKMPGRLLLASFFFFVLFIFPSAAQRRDTLKGPEIHIKVEKETDDQGNIIRYDSSYTWFWSSGDTVPADDSAFFRRFFSGPQGWHFGPGMLVPDSLPGIIFSPFDEDLDPFFFGFPDTAAIHRMEEMFRRFMEPFGVPPGGEDLFRFFGIPAPGDLFPGDTLFQHVFPPAEDTLPTRRKTGKVIIL